MLERKNNVGIILTICVSSIILLMIVVLIVSLPTKCKRTYDELTAEAKKVATELNQAPYSYRTEYNNYVQMEFWSTWLLSFDKSQEYVNNEGNDAIYISVSCADKSPLLLGGKNTWIEGSRHASTEVSNLGLIEKQNKDLNAYFVRYYYNGKYYQVTVIWKKDKEKACEIVNKIIGLEILK